MPIGSPVDLRWLETTEIAEVGAFQKGWYRLSIVKFKEPEVSKNGFLNMLPAQLKIETEEGGYAGETVFHRFSWPTAEGLEEGGYSNSTRRMWLDDMRAFLGVAFPKKLPALSAVDFDALEGLELYAFLAPGKEYQSQIRPEVQPRRWAAELPEGVDEGPQTA
mgnify:CR=1 FL=1